MVRLPPPGSKERYIQSIVKYLIGKGCFCWRQKVNSQMPKGVADIIGLTGRGQFFAITVKTPSSIAINDDQEHFLERVSDNNGIAFVAHSPDDVKIIMEGENYL